MAWHEWKVRRREFLLGGAAGLAAVLAGLPALLRSRAAAGPGAGAAPAFGRIRLYSARQGGYVMADRVVKTDAEWRGRLTREQFEVTRRKGTERAFTGKYWNNHEKGVYRCVCCGNDLFSSETKYESGTGWPSFFEPIAPENVRTAEDDSFFSRRTEVLCSRCDAHLGHVFNDGPKPTGLRYCMNSASLDFVKSG